MDSIRSGNGNKKAIHFDAPPKRVVSLVPSLTESMFNLGFGNTVVGVTDYCTQPAALLVNLPRLGGPKNPNVDAIIGLEPDLVLANQEENTRAAVETLESAGLHVWVSFPRTVRQALDVLWTLTGLFQSRTAAIRLETLEMAIEWAESALSSGPPRRYFCPIWQDQTAAGKHWWMTFNSQTYAHDVLRLVGGENVFAGRARRYPLQADLGEMTGVEAGDRDTRYPRLPLEEIQNADPEVILLPSEPFAFDESHRQTLTELLPDVSAVRAGRVHLVDGSLITWHGTRLAHALRDLPVLLQN